MATRAKLRTGSKKTKDHDGARVRKKTESVVAARRRWNESIVWPISPPPEKGGGGNDLPAYLSNGVIGLRVREMPLTSGLTLLSGYTCEHPARRIEAAAVAPYPVACDIRVAGVWISDAPHQVTVVDQAYDFCHWRTNEPVSIRGRRGKGPDQGPYVL